MDQLAKFGPLQALMKFWGQLTPIQRFITVLFISTSVVLLIVVSMVATRPKMSVLFSGVQAEDAGAIIAKLQEIKVPYEVDGTTIKVPEKNVYETRMQLASQGLPQSGTVGFELFDKNSFGMTDFMQRMNYQRAIQGELSRTINEIHGVVGSKVLVDIPEDSVFSEKEKKPTASVMLKLRAGSTLEPEQVAGIVHLVSSAIQGLDTNRVNVVDMNGNMLSEANDDPTGLDPRMSSSQLKLRREYERTVEQNIQSMLERVLGPSKAIVRVSAKINFDRKEENRETFKPLDNNKGVVTSEQRLDESYGTAPTTVGGVVGVNAINRGASVSVTPTGNKGGYQRLQTTNTYEVSKTTEHIFSAPGNVENTNVAVMVDGKVDASKIPAIRNVVATAAGIDETRGDKITVESIAFDDSTAKKEEKEMQEAAKQTTYTSLGTTIGGVLLVIVFLVFLKGMMKQLKNTVSSPVTVQEVSAEEAAILHGTAMKGYDSPEARAAATGTTFDATVDDAPKAPAREAVAENASPDFSQAQPQDIAQALRKWMSDNN